MCLLATIASLPAQANDDDREGGRAVYTMTNAAAGNGVMMYRRMSDGSLAPIGMTSTGGKGHGGGLGSQGSLVFNQSGRWLLAVNAGIDDLSVFPVGDSGISLVTRASHRRPHAYPLSQRALAGPLRCNSSRMAMNLLARKRQPTSTTCSRSVRTAWPECALPRFPSA